MSSLGVIFDGVVGSQTDPLWDRSVLLRSLCELDFRAEGLVRRHLRSVNKMFFAAGLRLDGPSCYGE